MNAALDQDPDSESGATQSREFSRIEPISFIVNCLLLLATVSVSYLDAARGCPDPNEGALFDTWSSGQVVRGGWPRWEVIVPYFFYHYLGVRTIGGLQFIGATISVVGLVFANYLAYFRLGLKGASRTILVTVLNVLVLAGDGKFFFFMRWGILAYPLRIFAGPLFIYLLVAYSNPTCLPRHRLTVLLGILLSALVYAHYVLVIPICAVIGSLAVGQLVRREFQWAKLRQFVVPILFLFAIPVTVGLIINWSDPQSQFAQPRASIRNLYFEYNDKFPKTWSGYVKFLAEMTKELVLQIAIPFKWIPVAWIWKLRILTAAALVAIAVATSFVRRHEVRFLIVVFLLIDLALRLAMNYLNHLPYGSVRYFLSQVFVWQLIVGLGIADLLGFLVFIVSSPMSSTRRDRVVRATTWIAAAVFAFSSAWLAVNDVRQQRVVTKREIETTGAVRSRLQSLRGATVLMTDDQERLIARALLGDEWFKANTVLNLPGRGTSPEAWKPEKKQAVELALNAEKEIWTMTFRTFQEDPYGPTGYDLVEPVYSREFEEWVWDVSVSKWTRKSASNPNP